MSLTAPLFGASNLDALLGHPQPTSLSAEIVAALRSVSTEAEARAAVRAISRRKLDEEQARLDAETANA